MDKSIEILRNLIQSRRSIFPKSYINNIIEESVIEQVIEAAIYAPTHKKTEPWRFVAFTGEGKSKLGRHAADIYKTLTPEDLFLDKKYNSFIEKADQAGCVVAIIVSLHPDKLPEWEEIASVGCAVQNMALTAESFNLGGYWSSPSLIINNIGDYLSLAPNEKCLGFYYLGYHNEAPKKAVRTPLERKLTWIKD